MFNFSDGFNKACEMCIQSERFHFAVKHEND